MIMVGPGTNCSIRAFLQQRKADSAEGRNWLFRRLDGGRYLYRDEISAYVEDGTLDKLDLAGLEGPEGVCYLMAKHATEI